MDKNTLNTVITEWQAIILKNEGITRVYQEPLLKTIGSKPIKIITGFRRSGKSFLVQQIAKQLHTDGIYLIDDILYLNFEDFRIQEIDDVKKLNMVYKHFRSTISKNAKKLLIFDEIHHVQDWDKFIRTLYEKDFDIEMIITGSNSELLSSELGTNLAGRFIEFPIYPFNFKEFLDYKGLRVEDTTAFYRNNETITKYFDEYRKFGGLPEVLTISQEQAKYSYIQGIISKVILDDIVKRFNVRRVDVIEKMLHYLLTNVGNMIAYSKVGNHLSEKEIKDETILNYIQYFIKSFSFYETMKFDWKLGKVFSASKKYYCVDTGLINAYKHTLDNYSKQLENIVFLHLKSRYSPIYYGRDHVGKEIDFIVKDTTDIFCNIQVTAQLTDQNFERELSPFALTDPYLKKGRNLLLTLNNSEDVVHYEKTTIEVKNLIEWLLDL